MFALEAQIGNYVAMEFVSHGKPGIVRGILQAVKPFMYLKIVDSSYTPFIGRGTAVMRVKDANMRILYKNDQIEEDYKATRTDEVNDYRKRSFGSNAVLSRWV